MDDVNIKIDRKPILDCLSDQEFKDIVLNSFSITEVTRKCGYKTYKSGGGREKVIKRIKNLGIGTEHFKSNGRQYEKPAHNKILDFTSVLCKKSGANRTTIKSILLRECLREYKCDMCGNIGFWNGQELSLQLHHKDGDITNNELDNLIFLCPNCHSQTDNYSYKNAKIREKKIFYCSDCGREITRYTRTGKCKECAAKLHTKQIPEKDDLIEKIKEIKFKKYICFHYGVSEKTLDLWLSSYELPTHIAELHKYILANNL